MTYPLLSILFKRKVNCNRAQYSNWINSGRIDTVSRSNGILSAEKPIQAFQFSTQTIKAFQLKPRAATVCTFDGMSGQTAVAYGFDGTVQFWDPSTREQLLSIGKEDLQMDMVDKVSQLTPSLIAVLAGGSAKGGVYDNKGSIALLSKERQLEPNTLQFRPPAYCTDSPHSGEISVVEGMPGFGGNNDDNRNNNPAFMLSGGEADKGVYMWAIGLSEQGAVTAIQQTHKMKTRHTTRITALCYEPFKGYAISGADGNGRINVNNVETGKLVVDNDHRQCGGGIGGISICPVDANLAMVCCTTKGKQVQIFDLRQSLSVLKPALLLGKDEGFRNSRYIRSAWHPDGRLVFCPLNEEGTKASGSGTVFIWDVRYVRCQEEEPQTYNPHSGSIWSACFARPSQTAESNNPMLVTVSSDRKIAFTDFSI
ncbi:hypothetical protein EV178_004145 [Coemansia sp. RSA 1646]|nr:hypothetical protein EV178_004145 [Coemansia sp. RSA 1646]